MMSLLKISHANSLIFPLSWNTYIVRVGDYHRLGLFLIRFRASIIYILMDLKSSDN